MIKQIQSSVIPASMDKKPRRLELSPIKVPTSFTGPAPKVAGKKESVVKVLGQAKDGIVNVSKFAFKKATTAWKNVKGFFSKLKK